MTEWKKYYFKIQKTPKPELAACKSKGDVMDFLILNGLAYSGGKDSFVNLLNKHKVLDRWTENHTKTLMKSINKASKSKVAILK